MGNSDIWQIANDIGDISMVQEAWGFEEDGAIADRLRLHGFKVRCFQKGKAPPLACLVRGPKAEQIRENTAAAEQMSGQTPDPSLKVSVVPVKLFRGVELIISMLTRLPSRPTLPEFLIKMMIKMMTAEVKPLRALIHGMKSLSQLQMKQ